MRSDSQDSIIGDFTAAWGAVIALVSVSIFVAFISFGYESRGQIALVSSVAIGSSLRIFWPIRYEIWFLLTMVAIVIAHVVVIIADPWSDGGLSGIRLAPIMVLDVVAIIGMVSLLNKLTQAISKD